MFKGKRYAGEPQSDVADLGSSLDDSDSGVSADEGVVQRPGVGETSGSCSSGSGKGRLRARRRRRGQKCG